MFNCIGNNCSGAMGQVALAPDSDMGAMQNNCVLIDVKGIFNRKEAEDMNYLYWRL